VKKLCLSSCFAQHILYVISFFTSISIFDTTERQTTCLRHSRVRRWLDRSHRKKITLASVQLVGQCSSRDRVPRRHCFSNFDSKNCVTVFVSAAAVCKKRDEKNDSSCRSAACWNSRPFSFGGALYAAQIYTWRSRALMRDAWTFYLVEHSYGDFCTSQYHILDYHPATGLTRGESSLPPSALHAWSSHAGTKRKPKERQNSRWGWTEKFFFKIIIIFIVFQRRLKSKFGNRSRSANFSGT